MDMRDIVDQKTTILGYIKQCSKLDPKYIPTEEEKQRWKIFFRERWSFEDVKSEYQNDELFSFIMEGSKKFQKPKIKNVFKEVIQQSLVMLLCCLISRLP